MRIQDLPIELVHPNPDQPRKEFEETSLRELASSIERNGLLQPIAVTPRGAGFMIVGGERRWRAHLLLEAETIRAIVEDQSDEQVDTMAVIENLQRQDITPLEEADAFQRMIDLYGYSVSELAERLGIRQSWRISDRLSLLRVRKRYRPLIESGQLTLTDAFELSRLEPDQQDVLMRMIAQGKVKTGTEVKAAAESLANAAEVIEMFETEPTVTKTERRQAARFESRMERVAALLRSAFNDENEVTAVRKVDPTNATRMADLAAAMRTDLLRLEKELRSAAATSATLFEMTG